MCEKNCVHRPEGWRGPYGGRTTNEDIGLWLIDEMSFPWGHELLGELTAGLTEEEWLLVAPERERFLDEMNEVEAWGRQKAIGFIKAIENRWIAIDDAERLTDCE